MRFLGRGIRVVEWLTAASYPSKYARFTGLLRYSWALRQLVLLAPVVAFILYSYAGPIAALIVFGVLFSFARFQPAPSQAS